jgi:hypothetical protein
LELWQIAEGTFKCFSVLDYLLKLGQLVGFSQDIGLQNFIVQTADELIMDTCG